MQQKSIGVHWSNFFSQTYNSNLISHQAAKVSYFSVWVSCHKTIFSFIPYDLLPEEKNNLEIFKNWAWVLWLTTLTGRPWLLCGFFSFDQNFFIAEVFVANCICKIHCLSTRWVQSLFTVHKLSSNKRKISSWDSNLGQLGERRKRFLWAMPGFKCSTKANFGHICAAPQENEPRSNKCFFSFLSHRPIWAPVAALVGRTVWNISWKKHSFADSQTLSTLLSMLEEEEKERRKASLHSRSAAVCLSWNTSFPFDHSS